jgi:hypothetical protein
LPTTYKNNRAIVAQTNVQALLRGRQIFKFGLLVKKDNKKNLKIQLVFNRMVVVFFPPYYSYTNPLAVI